MRRDQIRQYKLAAALVTVTVLAGCGGGADSGSSTVASPKIKFTSQVSFGDSLSDVGSYAVGTVAALHGGKYTVNSLTRSAQNWTELIATQLGLSAPCAAQTGLNGLASQGFSVPVVNHTGCTSYAQGGARVTNPVGPGNALLGGSNAILGQLTVPVVTQIQSHLTAVGGSFSGTEIVFVMAGGNDIFMNLAQLQADATAAGTAAATAAITAAVPGQIQTDIAAGTCHPTDAQASNCIAAAVAELTPTVGAQAGAAAGASYASNTGGPAAIHAMGVAGAELAGYIQNLIVAKGAKYVTVINLPDVAITPFGVAAGASTQQLMEIMINTFNGQLQSGLAGANVMYVDAYTASRDQIIHPSSYGLTNVTTPACNLSPAANPLGSSLVCNTANVIAGDVSHYEFADSVHPTPYGYQLLDQLVISSLTTAGWY